MSPKSFREIVGAPPSTATTKDSVLVNHRRPRRIRRRPARSYQHRLLATLLEKYRSSGGAVAHVVHITPEGAPVFTPKTALAEEFDELQPAEGSSTEFVVPKRFPGCFAETTLKSQIDKTGLKKVVLTGYMAHVCVSTTAREAYQLGYEVLAVEDAIGDRDIPGATGEEVTKMVLAELGDVFATVVKSSDIQ